MRAGKLRTRATLLHVDRTARDGFGEAAPSWCEYATVYSEVVEETGSEAVDANQRQVQVKRTRELRIRWRGDVLATDRVQFTDGTTWDVQTIVDVEQRRRELLLTLQYTK